VLKTIDGGVEGTLQDFEALAGDLLDAQKNSVAMQRTERDCLEDEHLECALREFNWFVKGSPLSEKGEYALSPFPSRRRVSGRLRQVQLIALEGCDSVTSTVDKFADALSECSRYASDDLQSFRFRAVDRLLRNNPSGDLSCGQHKECNGAQNDRPEHTGSPQKLGACIPTVAKRNGQQLSRH
jgi:hypothetical protein